MGTPAGPSPEARETEASLQQSVLFIQVQSHSPRLGGGSPRDHELVYLLKGQLAEAVNLQNKDLVLSLIHI